MHRFRVALGCACAAGVMLIQTAAGAAAAHPDQKVLRAVEMNRTGAIELLRSIVDIDSGTGDVAGGAKVEAVLIPALEALGAQVVREPSETPGLPDSIVAVLHGTGRSKLLIIAHIDTVFAAGTAATRPFAIVGDRAHGPGVGDEKAGVVNAVMALKILHDMGFKKYATITLFLDNSEERGSPGSMQHIKTLAAQSDVEFNMEPGDPPDALTVWRKGSTNIRIHVQGRAAHAGMAPQDGRNAAVELVHQLSLLDSAFPHSGDGTTVNLTLINAGERMNIIPQSAEATLNVRYRKDADFDAVLARVEQSAATTVIPDTVVTVLHDPAFPPLTENAAIDGLAARAQTIYAELGKSIDKSGNGGASESAIAMSVGTPALDGLGAVGSEFHTDHEWIDVASMTSRLYLLTRLLIETATHPPAKSANVDQVR